ncbi:MAG: hypothetical protein GYB64_01975 [Chloroflexi bacterium]|nr:hypothetical protein [Chloroflexota bacterium]
MPIWFAFLLVAAGLTMQDPTPEVPVTTDEVNAIASGLYCPVCENVPLDVCGTQACADWRAEIRAMLEAGATEEEIRASFADRYGRRVLATPDAASFDRFLWVLPVGGALIGAVVLIVGLTRIAPDALIAGAGQAPAAAYDDLDPEYVARVESDLQEFTL